MLRPIVRLLLCYLWAHRWQERGVARAALRRRPWECQRCGKCRDYVGVLFR